MRFNTRADLAGGRGAGFNSLWLYGGVPRVLSPAVDGAVWQDDHRILSRDNGLRQMVLFTRVDDFSIAHGMLPPQPFVSDWYGGGGNWAGTILSGDYPTDGSFNGGPLPDWLRSNHAVMDASRAGDLLFRRAGDWALIVLWADGSWNDLGIGWLEARLGDGGVIAWNGTDLILWDRGHGPTHCDHVPVAGLNKPMRVGEWVSYASDELGRVLHLWNDATLGYYLTMVYSPDLLAFDGVCLAAGSLNEGETPAALIRDPGIVLGAGMVPLLTNPSPGPDPEPTPEPPDPGPDPEPEPPHPEPEPPMATKKTIVIVREGSSGPVCLHVKGDDAHPPPDRGRFAATVPLSQAATDPRCHFTYTIFDQPGHAAGMHTVGNKVVIQSAQDQVCAVPDKRPNDPIPPGSELKAALNPGGFWEIRTGHFPNTWEYADPALGTTTAIAVWTDGRVTLETEGTVGPDQFALKLYELKNGTLTELVGDFRPVA